MKHQRKFYCHKCAVNGRFIGKTLRGVLRHLSSKHKLRLPLDYWRTGWTHLERGKSVPYNSHSLWEFESEVFPEIPKVRIRVLADGPAC